MSGHRASGCVHHWQVTKYDPQFRHELRDEWTGAGEIGEAFPFDGVLTENEYRRVEALYACAARLLWMESGQPPLQIQGLETPTFFGLPAQLDSLDDVGFEDWRPVNGEFIPGAHLLEAVVRWCLREFGWCYLVAPGFYVTFGYDYYMYAGTTDSVDSARRAITSSGLFVEPCDPQGPKGTPNKFRIEAAKVGEIVVDHDHELTGLSAQAAADLWPEITALVGYAVRPIDGPMAEQINRYARFDFDFERFTYSLADDDD